MTRRWARCVVIFGLVVACVFPVAGESLLRSLGVRLVLPWTGAPLLFGLEATTDLGEVVGTAAFYLDPSGRTLITVGANVPLGDPGTPLQAAVRVSTGLAYLRPGAFGPLLLAGIGAAYEVHAASPWFAGFSVELVYPIAFPTPLITVNAGYLFHD